MSDVVPTAPIIGTRLTIELNGISALRAWRPIKDGRLAWRSDPRATRAYVIARKNESPPKEKSVLRGKNGVLFRPVENPITLDDFVYIYQENVFVHLRTDAELIARQINRIFIRGNWPICYRFNKARSIEDWDESGIHSSRRIAPSAFIRRFSKIMTMDIFNSESEVWRAR